MKIKSTEKKSMVIISLNENSTVWVKSLNPKMNEWHDKHIKLKKVFAELLVREQKKSKMIFQNVYNEVSREESFIIQFLHVNVFFSLIMEVTY